MSANIAISPRKAGKSKIKSWFKRGLIGVSVLLLGLGSAGAIYQTVATKIDQYNYPPPGKLVDAGGHKLHLHVMGKRTSSPTVVLEAGLGSLSSQWGWVQPEVAKFTQVVAYDRAGLGWSENSNQPRDAKNAAQQLHTALRNAGIPGPYVLVGHSLGGVYVRVFAELYPDEVAGVVLVDTIEGVWQRLPQESIKEITQFQQIVKLMPLLAQFGVLRFVDAYPQLKDLPQQQRGEAKAFYASVKHLNAVRDELPQQLSNSASLTQVKNIGNLQDKPLVVLSRTTPSDIMTQAHQESHAELAKLSTRGSHRLIPDADHFSLVTQQKDALATIKAIQDVITIVETTK